MIETGALMTISPAPRPWLSSIRQIDPELLKGDLIGEDHPLFGLVWINPERMSGAACFYASRVPIKNLFDYLEGDYSLGEFLADFEGVTREQAIGVIELAQTDFLTNLPKP
jgi:uncharacterized protein (DUF433 family)